LIIASIFGAIAAKIGIRIPTFALNTMNYFEALATP